MFVNRPVIKKTFILIQGGFDFSFKGLMQLKRIIEAIETSLDFFYKHKKANNLIILFEYFSQ